MTEPSEPLAEPPSGHRPLSAGLRRGTWLVALAVVAMLIVFIWASDAITLQGERTIYTAECQAGEWQGAHCTGRLVVGPRYRFRALMAHSEVLFWTVGASGPSHKFSDCTITDGRNWTCRPNADAGQTVTLHMSRGRPAPAAGDPTRAYHAVSKVHWWLLSQGLSPDSDALN
jgi:hypothetical protein